MLDVVGSGATIERESGHRFATRRQRILSRRMARDLLVVAELSVIVGCGILAKILYIDGILNSQPEIGPYFNVSVLGAVFSYFTIKHRGLYDENALASVGARTSIRKMGLGLGFAFLILIAIGYLAKDAHTYSRGWMLTWFGSAFFALILVRGIGQSLFRHMQSRGYFRQRVAVVGAGPIARRLLEYLQGQEESVDVVGIFADAVSEKSGEGDHYVTAGLPSLIALARVNPIDRVIIALPSQEEERIAEAMRHLGELPSQIDLCPNLMSLKGRASRLDNLGRLSLLEIQPKPIEGWDGVSKIVLDYALASIFLLALSPLMMLVAIAIKLDSRGPVFFRQRRHGFNHRVVDVWKFRTMKVMEDGPEFRQATKGDDRITRVGRFLRRTSIDELPQFWNVLCGEMSIVGPRPHALAHNDQFFVRFKDYANRHKVKPGITGWAQVNGSRGETDTPEKMRERVDYDLAYIKRWSVWFDLQIILRTIVIVLCCKNAH